MWANVKKIKSAVDCTLLFWKIFFKKGIDFWNSKLYNTLMELKSEVLIMSPRTGRPTDSLKNHDIKVRIDENTHQKLLKYCEENKISKAEAIRQGIHMVLTKK